MTHIALVAISMDIFLFVTFTGVFLYLIRIYKMWEEPSIGFWGIASLLVAVSIFFHIISIQTVNLGDTQNSVQYYQIAVTVSFISYWAFGISHMIARRSTVDVLGLAFISIFLGLLIQSVWVDKFRVNITDKMVVEQKVSFSSYYISLFSFLALLYLILARDSYLMYKASLKNKESKYHRSIAFTHLLAWQFWGISTIVIRYIGSNQQYLIFIFPFIFLLVPIITLGSRPFDWAREGYEPTLLLLIDEYGTPAFSWVKNMHSPLLMEGSSIATITTMLETITNDEVKNMNVSYMNNSIYLQASNGNFSLLITTGHHRSFMKLLTKIHTILVTSIVGPTEFGIPGYDIPNELQWLLSQLLPDKHYSVSRKKKTWKEFLISKN